METLLRDSQGTGESGAHAMWHFPLRAGGNVILDAWAKSDVGKHRIVNEDCCYVDPEIGLMLVLDGMGGHRAGEVASNLAMETIVSFYKEHMNDAAETSGLFENYDPAFTFEANLLRQAAFMANRAILKRASDDDGCVGMGSTVTGMVFQGTTVSVMNVGDSRLYMLRNGRIEQISRDHTLAEDQVERGIMSREEARESQLKHVLSSVIGVDPRVRVHLDVVTAMPGDIFLLCTDGLTAVMNEDEILEMVLSGKPCAETLDRLLAEVDRRGSPDNTTLALVVCK